MSSSNYQAPQWRYDFAEPTGKKMLMLSIEEAKLTIKLLRRHVKHSNCIKHPDHYKPPFREHMDYADKIWLSANRYLRNIEALPIEAVNHNDMDALNQELQLIFTDIGWRWIRKAISQAKKRENKARMEVSTDLIEKLKAIMDREGIETFDDVLDHLITLDKNVQAGNE